MKVLVISEADYDDTSILGVVTTLDAAVALVKSWHKQKTLRIETDATGITATYRGGVSYYGLHAFDVEQPGGDERDPG